MSTNNSKKYQFLTLIFALLFIGAIALFLVGQKRQAIYQEEQDNLHRELRKKEQIITAFSLKSEHLEDSFEFITRSTVKRLSFENFDLYYDLKHKKGFIFGPEIKEIPMNQHYQLWIKGNECLSVGLFSYDEFLTGSDIFDLNLENGKKLILSKEKMGGAKVPTESSIVEHKILAL